ncbi:hypothetical protein GHT06_013846 [Daphnia sinensis]|uniref:V-SNARE coiled-coil homology domain-containing protein n=1 Tax=Daphnia sinensis TaxID=1820382 RepID=A0AAD5KUK5_9CRUS|nr:hypothetical protein GHT06_013846 [Daphnia sinensis]
MFTAKCNNQSPAHFNDLQDQVDEVMDVMRHTTEAVLDRGARLSELSARAEALEHQANAFLKRTTDIRKEVKKNHRKWMWILGGIAVITLAIVNTILFS